jgi:hypothetical protein
MATTNKLLPIALSTKSISGTYQAFTALPQPCVILHITNGSNDVATISFDGGATDHEAIPASNQIYLNAQANSLPNAFNAAFAKGTSIAVKGPGAGTVYLAGFYQAQGV